MRWPWTGIEEEVRENRRQYARLVEEYSRFTTQLVEDMHRKSEERERAVNARLEEIHEETREILAEQRAGREALFRMLDRLPPPATGTA